MFVEDEHVETAYNFGFCVRANHLKRGTNCLGIMHVHARDECICMTESDHHRSEIISVEEKLLRFAMTQAFSLPALPQIVGVFFAVQRARGIFNANVGEENRIFARETMNDVGISKKNRKRDSFVEEHLRGA